VSGLDSHRVEVTVIAYGCCADHREYQSPYLCSYYVYVVFSKYIALYMKYIPEQFEKLTFILLNTQLLLRINLKKK
jgi:hypothetical protein